MRSTLTSLFLPLLSALAYGFLHASILAAESSLQQPPTQQHTISAYSEYFSHNRTPGPGVKGRDRTSPRMSLDLLNDSSHVHNSSMQPGRPSSESYSQHSSLIFSRPHSTNETASNSNNTSEKTSHNNQGTTKPPATNDPSFSSSFPNPFSSSSSFLSSPQRSREVSGLERMSLIIDTAAPLNTSYEKDKNGNIFPFRAAVRGKQSSPLSKVDQGGLCTSLLYDDSPPNEAHWDFGQSVSCSRRGSFNDLQLNPHTQYIPQYTTGVLGGVASNSLGSSNGIYNSNNKMSGSNSSATSTTVNNVFGYVTATPPTISNISNCDSNLRLR